MGELPTEDDFLVILLGWVNASWCVLVCPGFRSSEWLMELDTNSNVELSSIFTSLVFCNEFEDGKFSV